MMVLWQTNRWANSAWPTTRTYLLTLLLMIRFDTIISTDESSSNNSSFSSDDGDSSSVLTISHVLEPFEADDIPVLVQMDDAIDTVHLTSSNVFAGNYSLNLTAVNHGDGVLFAPNKTTTRGCWLPSPTAQLSLQARTTQTNPIENITWTVRECNSNETAEENCTEQSMTENIDFLYWTDIRMDTKSFLLSQWQVEWSTATTGASTTSSTLLLDQLACVGSGNLFGQAFFMPLRSPFWTEHYYNSPISAERTHRELAKGTLTLNYTIEQTEVWGGYLEYRHILPNREYYNLSHATHIAMDYRVLKPASAKGRAHMRIILLDGSECFSGQEAEEEGEEEATGCDAPEGTQLENHYSFHFILDDVGSGTVVVELRGSSNATDPFWRPGWFGVVGNDVLDKEHIKGFRLELSMDSQGGIGALVSGELQLSNLRAVVLDAEDGESSNNGARGVSNDTSPSAFVTQCVPEPEVSLDLFSSNFTLVEFANDCCAMCQDDPECRFAVSDSRACYLGSTLLPDSVQLVNTLYEKRRYTFFWKNQGDDFCETCVCDESSRTIDCRGRGLLAVPTVFNEDWAPLELDLTENDGLVLLGTNALVSLRDELETLRLPQNLKYSSLSYLPNLQSITFEGDHGHTINNVMQSSGFYGDVCCSRGEHMDLSSPKEGLSFCVMNFDAPGADAVYEPFVQYFHAEALVTLTPSSLFMNEAAESVEKCAAYCTQRDGCNYFSYDARVQESEHTCYLLAAKGEAVEVCCNEDDYGDDEGTIPGWTSGRVPRSRVAEDNARVLSDSDYIEVEESNGFATSYTLSLGSTPTRGAVWVEPALAMTEETKLKVSFVPPRVALYDNISLATIEVTVTNTGSISTGETLVVANNVKSCDPAFSISTSALSGNTIYIHVLPPESSSVRLLAWILVLTAVALMAVFALVYVNHSRQKTDTVWKVNVRELKFSEPPRIIGRGTFGTVVLAEYRGTKVAVKRVLPPKNDGTSGTFSALIFGGGEKDLRPLDGATDDERTLEFDVDNGHDEELGTMDLTAPFLSRETARDSSLGTQSTLSPQERASSPGLRSTGSSIGLRKKQWAHIPSLRDDYATLKSDFIREMRILSKLRHPCITTVMGAVISRKEDPMLVMEYMDHGSLGDLLHNETFPIDGEMILPILQDITQGVRFLHASRPQVIHGDLKAQNILVDSKFRAKVADFGLSQKRKLGATGTPYWMAPELLRGESTNTAASDIYSFGIILYEVYSRQSPYEGEEYWEVLQLVCDPKVNKRPPAPAACPADVKTIMVECLEGEPELRPTFEDLDKRLRLMDALEVEPGQSVFSHRVKKERRREELLFEVFPKHVAQALAEGRKVEPERREEVTIFFSDIVGFTTISSTIPALKVSDMLDRLYNKFDDLSISHDVFKLETIGDAYMAVTNLIKDQNDHAKRIALFAIDAVKAANETLIDVDEPSKGYVNIRVGFHSGPVVANVVGNRNPKYTLFGDTVNTSSRMESNSKTNRIQCSYKSARLLRKQDAGVKTRQRGRINVKGKGQMYTYWVSEQRGKSANKIDYKSSSSSLDDSAIVGWESGPDLENSMIVDFPLPDTPRESPLQQSRKAIATGGKVVVHGFSVTLNGVDVDEPSNPVKKSSFARLASGRRSSMGLPRFSFPKHYGSDEEGTKRGAQVDYDP